ncbi:MAG: fumarate hydratase [Chloroflexi bacterium]|nr:fumarate hydratase [Chloroflexota bacterium]
MIHSEDIEKTVYDLIVQSACILPDNIRKALEKAYQEETAPLAKLHLETTVKHMNLSRDHMIQLCGDTGYPVFYVRAGERIFIEGGIPALERAISAAVKQATEDAWLRPTVVDPLTRDNPGTNLGHHMPYIEYKFSEDLDFMEITAAPKGGGTEIFGPSFRVLLHADGLLGVKRFVIDSMVQVSRTGSVCPPNIVGVGIGGTADLCMKLAKQAAVLRPVGSRHPEDRIARLEEELLEALNATGIGPLAAGGKTTALDVHIEYALGHLAGFPAAICVQCPAARVATVRLHEDGTVHKMAWPQWFGQERETI